MFCSVLEDLHVALIMTIIVIITIIIIKIMLSPTTMTPRSRSRFLRFWTWWQAGQIADVWSFVCVCLKTQHVEVWAELLYVVQRTLNMCSASLVSLVDPAMALHMKNTSVFFSMSSGFFLLGGDGISRIRCFFENRVCAVLVCMMVLVTFRFIGLSHLHPFGVALPSWVWLVWVFAPLVSFCGVGWSFAGLFAPLVWSGRLGFPTPWSRLFPFMACFHCGRLLLLLWLPARSALSWVGS